MPGRPDPRPSKNAVGRHGDEHQSPPVDDVPGGRGPAWRPAAWVSSSVPSERVGAWRGCATAGWGQSSCSPQPTFLARALLTAPEPVVALCPRKVHAAGRGPPKDGRGGSTRIPKTPPRAPEPSELNSAGRLSRIHPFTSRRFHVLLNSLFKVLFNFPSRYLCAIGLVHVFSLRWSLPPALGCIPKQPDSGDARSRPTGRPRKGLTPAQGEAPIRRTSAAGSGRQLASHTPQLPPAARPGDSVLG